MTLRFPSLRAVSLPRCALLLALPLSALGAGGAENRPARPLLPPSPGLTLPVVLEHTLEAGKVKPGTPVFAKTTQRILLSPGESLHPGARLGGQVVSSAGNTLGIEFTRLTYRHQSVRLKVRLIAAASYVDVFDTRLPMDGSDRAANDPADWTTRQIGGDVVYRSGGSGAVYDRYSRRIGYANFSGVFAYPAPPLRRISETGAKTVPLAMGPFSSTASGLHGMPGMNLASDGGPQGGTIVFTAAHRPPKLMSGDAFLLQVAP